MTAQIEGCSAPLLEVLVEVSALLEDCSDIAQQLEQAIGDWLKQGADPARFPVAELQSIDLIRQIQQDLSALLCSKELASEISRNHNSVDIASVITTPKLERVRNRLLQLAKGRIELTDPRHSRGPSTGSGLVDLF